MQYPVGHKKKQLINDILAHEYTFMNKKYQLADHISIILNGINRDEFYDDEDRPMLTQIREEYINSKMYNKEVSTAFALKYLKETTDGLPF
jgi:hypothetical protein